MSNAESLLFATANGGCQLVETSESGTLNFVCSLLSVAAHGVASLLVPSRVVPLTLFPAVLALDKFRASVASSLSRSGMSIKALQA